MNFMLTNYISNYALILGFAQMLDSANSISVSLSVHLLSSLENPRTDVFTRRPS